MTANDLNDPSDLVAAKVAVFSKSNLPTIPF